MILVDKDIKSLGDKLIIEGYDEDCVGAVSYDVKADIFFKSSETDSYDRYVLKPNEYIIVKTKEKIHMPGNLLGIIGEKNSLIRLGLLVSGPRYQPGHKTYIYLRVLNVSSNSITLNSGLEIAQIFFEKLTSIPDNCYDKIECSSFNDETTYIGFGKYDSCYNDMLK